MAKFFFFLVAALCFLQASEARKRDAGAEPPSQLEELSKKTSAFLDDLGTQFKSLIDAKDAKEAEDIIRTNTNKFIENLSDVSKQLQEKLSATTGDAQTALGKVIQNLNATITDLQAQNPEMTARAKEIGTKLEEGFKSVLQQADEITKQVDDNTKEVREDFVKLSKKTYDAVLESAQKVQKQIHDAANKA